MIIVSALSHRDKGRLRDREIDRHRHIERAWQQDFSFLEEFEDS